MKKSTEEDYSESGSDIINRPCPGIPLGWRSRIRKKAADMDGTKVYMQTPNVMTLFEDLCTDIMLYQPPDPLQFLLERLQGDLLGTDDSQVAESKIQLDLDSTLEYEERSGVNQIVRSLCADIIIDRPEDPRSYLMSLIEREMEIGEGDGNYEIRFRNGASGGSYTWQTPRPERQPWKHYLDSACRIAHKPWPKHVAAEILQGCYESAMQADRTFCPVFISAMSDFVPELAMFYRDCLPFLRFLARSLGMEMMLPTLPFPFPPTCDMGWPTAHEYEALSIGLSLSCAGSRWAEAFRQRTCMRSKGKGIVYIPLLGDKVGPPGMPMRVSGMDLDKLLRTVTEKDAMSPFAAEGWSPGEREGIARGIRFLLEMDPTGGSRAPAFDDKTPDPRATPASIPGVCAAFGEDALHGYRFPALGKWKHPWRTVEAQDFSLSGAVEAALRVLRRAAQAKLPKGLREEYSLRPVEHEIQKAMLEARLTDADMIVVRRFSENFNDFAVTSLDALPDIASAFFDLRSQGEQEKLSLPAMMPGGRRKRVVTRKRGGETSSPSPKSGRSSSRRSVSMARSPKIGTEETLDSNPGGRIVTTLYAERKSTASGREGAPYSPPVNPIGAGGSRALPSPLSREAGIAPSPSSYQLSPPSPEQHARIGTSAPTANGDNTEGAGAVDRGGDTEVPFLGMKPVVKGLAKQSKYFDGSVEVDWPALSSWKYISGSVVVDTEALAVARRLRSDQMWYWLSRNKVLDFRIKYSTVGITRSSHLLYLRRFCDDLCEKLVDVMFETARTQPHGGDDLLDTVLEQYRIADALSDHFLPTQAACSILSTLERYTMSDGGTLYERPASGRAGSGLNAPLSRFASPHGSTTPQNLQPLKLPTSPSAQPPAASPRTPTAAPTTPGRTLRSSRTLSSSGLGTLVSAVDQKRPASASSPKEALARARASRSAAASAAASSRRRISLRSAGGSDSRPGSGALTRPTSGASHRPTSRPSTRPTSGASHRPLSGASTASSKPSVNTPTVPVPPTEDEALANLVSREDSHGDDNCSDLASESEDASRPASAVSLGGIASAASMASSLTRREKEGGVVVVAGDPGTGKSTTLAQFVKQLHAANTAAMKQNKEARKKFEAERDEALTAETCAAVDHPAQDEPEKSDGTAVPETSPSPEDHKSGSPLPEGEAGSRQPEEIEFPFLVTRFLGASKELSTASMLLRSLCLQIHKLYWPGLREEIPYAYNLLQEKFAEQLELISSPLEGPDLHVALPVIAQPGSSKSSRASSASKRPAKRGESAKSGTSGKSGKDLKYPRRLVLVIDGMDHLLQPLSGPPEGPQWVPLAATRNVRLVFGCACGDNEYYLRLSPRRDLEEANVHTLQLSPLSTRDECMFLKQWIVRAGKTITVQQKADLLSALDANPSPLYASMALRNMYTWTIRTGPNMCRLPKSFKMFLIELFNAAIDKHGRKTTVYALGLLTASRAGLSIEELSDLLSLQDDVLYTLFPEQSKDGDNPYFIRRFPPILLVRLIEDLGNALCAWQCRGGATLHHWRHTVISKFAASRFLGTGDDKTIITERFAKKLDRHVDLAEYFSGKWVNVKKTFMSRTNSQEPTNPQASERDTPKRKSSASRPSDASSSDRPHSSSVDPQAPKPQSPISASPALPTDPAGPPPEATCGGSEAVGGEPEATRGESEAGGGGSVAGNGEPEATSGESEAAGGESVASGGERASTAGGEPEATGGESEAAGGEPEAAGGEPEAAGGESEAVGGNAEAAGGRPEATGDESAACGSEPEAAGGDELEPSGGESSSRPSARRGSESQASEADTAACKNAEDGDHVTPLLSVLTQPAQSTHPSGNEALDVSSPTTPVKSRTRSASHSPSGGNKAAKGPERPNLRYANRYVAHMPLVVARRGNRVILNERRVMEEIYHLREGKLWSQYHTKLAEAAYEEIAGWFDFGHMFLPWEGVEQLPFDSTAATMRACRMVKVANQMRSVPYVQQLRRVVLPPSPVGLDRVFFITEPCARDLSSVVAEKREAGETLPITEVKRLCYAVLKSLEQLHDVGVAHMLITASSIFVSDKGEYRLSHFHEAHVHTANLKPSPVPCCVVPGREINETLPICHPPEWIHFVESCKLLGNRGSAGYASYTGVAVDLWMLGSLLAELVLGTPPFRALIPLSGAGGDSSLSVLDGAEPLLIEFGENLKHVPPNERVSNDELVYIKGLAGFDSDSEEEANHRSRSPAGAGRDAGTQTSHRKVQKSGAQAKDPLPFMRCPTAKKALGRGMCNQHLGGETKDSLITRLKAVGCPPKLTDLIFRLMCLTPSRRLSAQDALYHPFLLDYDVDVSIWQPPSKPQTSVAPMDLSGGTSDRELETWKNHFWALQSIFPSKETEPEIPEGSLPLTTGPTFDSPATTFSERTFDPVVGLTPGGSYRDYPAASPNFPPRESTPTDRSDIQAPPNTKHITVGSSSITSKQADLT